MLPVAQDVCSCNTLQSQDSPQKLTFCWFKANGQIDFSMPQDNKATAANAVLICSMVSCPVAVLDQTAFPEAASEADAAADAEADAEAAAKEPEPAPHSHLAGLQQKCIAGRIQDPYFRDQTKSCPLIESKRL